MINQETRLQALSTFLKSKRAKIAPESVGFPMGSRRRTPGLRREEVAQLAGVSPTWYTWLEQGRDIKVSTSVLDCVASALQLNDDERNYLYALAMETSSSTVQHKEKPSEITPSLQRILQELRFCPTIVSDRRCEIVGWNQAASHVFMDFQQIPAEQRNIIQLLFKRKEFRRLAGNWEHFVGGYLSIFRTYYGQYMQDGWYEAFIDEMKRDHPEFQSLWEQSQVSTAPDVLLEFRHAKVGKMLFNLTSFQVQGNNDLRCSVYTPALESSTEAKLRRLMDRND